MASIYATKTPNYAQNDLGQDLVSEIVAFHLSGRPLHRCHQDLTALKVWMLWRRHVIHQNHKVKHMDFYGWESQYLINCSGKTYDYEFMVHYMGEMYCEIMIFYYQPESNPVLEDYESRISRIPLGPFRAMSITRYSARSIDYGDSLHDPQYMGCIRLQSVTIIESQKSRKTAIPMYYSYKFRQCLKGLFWYSILMELLNMLSV